MEIKRINGSSNIPIDTETRELPQQRLIQRGIGNISDSFETASQKDSLSMTDTMIRQPSEPLSSGLDAMDNNLQHAEGDAAVDPPYWMIQEGYPRVAYDD